MPKFLIDPNAQFRRSLPEELVALWRYQDLAKLIWTLEHQALWFCRADCLNDPFEGSRTLVARETLAGQLSALPQPEAEKALQSLSRTFQLMRRSAAVSCWHVGEDESAAMWSIYAPTAQGVALVSNLKRLRDAIPAGTAKPIGLIDGAPPVIHVELGLVKYIDHFDPRDAHLLDRPHQTTEPLFLKRQSFAHERELRAIISGYVVREKQIDLAASIFPNGGVAVPVSIETLIEAVVVAPGAPAWYRSAVEATLRRFNHAVPVRQSSLDREPIF